MSLHDIVRGNAASAKEQIPSTHMQHMYGVRALSRPRCYTLIDVRYVRQCLYSQAWRLNTNVRVGLNGAHVALRDLYGAKEAL